MTGIVQTLIGGFGAAAAVVTDAYFYLTTLLLPGNGTNGAQNNTFLDSSSNNFSITRNPSTGPNAPTQGTFSPFSQTGWSVYFNRAVYTDIFAASSADFNFGSGDFTIECFFNPSYVPASGDTTFSRLFDTGQLSCFFYSGNIYLRNAAAAELVTVVAHGLSVGVWYHLAIVRSGTTYYIFRNGSQLTSGTGGTITSASAPFVIGTNTSYNQPLDGNVSNFRVTTGQALYTSTFTPATTPLTTTSQSATASNVKLLTCQSNRFVDNSTQNTKTILLGDNGANPGTRFVQAFEPFAPGVAYSAATVGGSGYFDGTSDNLVVGGNTNLSLDADFTVECWQYMTSTTGTKALLANSGNTTGAGTFTLVYQSGTSTLEIFIGSSATSKGTFSVPINSWQHIAVIRSGTGTNNVKLYLNGVQQLQFSDNSTYLLAGVSVGAYNTNANYFPGYIAGVRVIKGQALSSGAFTPPSSPVTTTAVGWTGANVAGSLTGTCQLLLNFTNAGITDATAKNDLETVGNAQISTAQSKFGGSSMSFDGTGDWIQTPALPPAFLFQNNSDWTIEFWFFTGTGTGIMGIFDTYQTNSSPFSGLIIQMINGTISVYDGAANRATTTTYANSTWHHFAWVNSSGTSRIYINGTNVTIGSVTSWTTPANIFRANAPIQIGRDSTPYYFNGYIDDLRVTKFARYAANFTPPTSAFPLQ